MFITNILEKSNSQVGLLIIFFILERFIYFFFFHFIYEHHFPLLPLLPPAHLPPLHPSFPYTTKKPVHAPRINSGSTARLPHKRLSHITVTPIQRD